VQHDLARADLKRDEARRRRHAGLADQRRAIHNRQRVAAYQRQARDERRHARHGPHWKRAHGLDNMNQSQGAKLIADPAQHDNDGTNCRSP